MNNIKKLAIQIMDANPTIPGEALKTIEQTLHEANQNYLCLKEDLRDVREDLRDIQEELNDLIDSCEEPWKDDGQSLFNVKSDPEPEYRREVEL